MSTLRIQPLRLLTSVLSGVLFSLTFVGVSHADAPGPTDYSSTITSIDTPEGSSLPAGVNISVEGHDSFLAIRVTEGVTVEISGYEGEPYLQIDENCHVVENQRAMSTWYNRERFGSDVDRSLVNHELPPEWKQIGSNCAVAWHDHRLHYMSPSAPVNAEPGDILVIDSIPILISELEVEVHVESVLIKRPSRVVPTVVAALALVISALLLRLRLMSIATTVSAALALVFGGAQYLWSAPETGPQLSIILTPLLAVVAGGWAVRSRHTPMSIATIGAQLLGGVLLAVWVWQHVGVITAALLPTSLPYVLDRAGTAAIASIAVVSIAHAAVVLGRLASAGPAPMVRS